MQLTHKWQPDVWPDYSALPLPPGAERGQYAYRVAQAVVQPPSAPGMEAPDSPWHASYDAAFWAAQGFDPSTAHVPARRDAAAAAAAAAAAGNSAALYEQQRMAAQLTHQRLLLQQQRARGMSTAAAAEADEFDAGLFKEAAGVGRWWREVGWGVVRLHLYARGAKLPLATSCTLPCATLLPLASLHSPCRRRHGLCGGCQPAGAA